MIRSRIYYFLWGMIGLFLLLLPKVLSMIHIHLATEILIFALFALSFNLVFGYSGLLPFGHGALFGVGAYVAVLIFKHFPGMPLLLTVLITALSGGLVAAFIGLFCVRLKAAYFALITLAFQMFLFAIALKWRSLTYGEDGMSITRPDLNLFGFGNISMHSVQNVYYLTLVIVTIGILICYLFLKTPLGNSVISVKEKDIRASFLGYNVFLTKLAVYSFSGIFASVAGGLYSFFQEFVNTAYIDLNMSMSAVFMTVIGGSGHFMGPVLGAAFYIIFQDWISSMTQHWWIWLGLVFVLIVYFEGGGLINLFNRERIDRFLSRLRK